MAVRNWDPGSNPTAPASMTLIGSEEAQNVCLVDGTNTSPLGSAAKPLPIILYGPDGYSTFYWFLLGFIDIPTVVVGDPVTAAPWDLTSGWGKIQGAAASGAVNAGNPVKQGLTVLGSLITPEADTDAINAAGDKQGRTLVTGVTRGLEVENNITLSTTTETTLLSAGASGIFNDLTLLVLSNTSDTKTRVDIRDATGGTVRLSVSLAASGGGAVIPWSALNPKRQTTAANNWTAQLSTAVTDVRVYAHAIQNK